MTISVPENDLRRFVDAVYACTDDCNAPDILKTLFSALRRQFSFSSGLFVRFDPSDLSLTVPYAHDIAPEHMRAYLEHYYLLDPYRVSLTNLGRPDEVVRMSDFVDVREVSRGEFGEAMRLIDYFHAMSVVPVVRGVPLGAIAVHRPCRQADFGADEKRVFRWFVGHAAKAIDYGQLALRLRRPEPATLVVDISRGRVLSVTEAAHKLLAELAENQALVVPVKSNCPGLLLVQGRAYAVRSADLGPASLWSVPASAGLTLNSSPGLTARKVRVSAGDRRERVLVVIELIGGVDDAAGKLSGLGLSPRQTQVALQLVLGKGIKEIARTCGISINTAKEYAADVYERLNVHTRHALVERMAGAGGVDSRSVRSAS